VFEEEPVAPAAAPHATVDIFAEMNPYMVDCQDLGDSRESIYTRMGGE
jgi:hypothetical protein